MAAAAVPAGLEVIEPASRSDASGAASAAVTTPASAVVAEVADEAAELVEVTAGVVADKAEEQVKETAGMMAEVAEEVVELADEVGVVAAEAAKEAAELAEVTAGVVAEKADKQVQETAGVVAKVAEEAVELADEAAGVAAEAAQEAAELAEVTAGLAAEKAEKQVKELAGAVAEVAEEAVELADEAAGGAAEAAEEAAELAEVTAGVMAEKAEKQVKETAGAVAEVAEEAVELADEAAGVAAEAAEEAAELAEVTAGLVVEKAEEQVKETAGAVAEVAEEALELANEVGVVAAEAAKEAAELAEVTAGLVAEKAEEQVKETAGVVAEAAEEAVELADEVGVVAAEAAAEAAELVEVTAKLVAETAEEQVQEMAGVVAEVAEEAVELADEAAGVVAELVKETAEVLAEALDATATAAAAVAAAAGMGPRPHAAAAGAADPPAPAAPPPPPRLRPPPGRAPAVPLPLDLRPSGRRTLTSAASASAASPAPPRPPLDLDSIARAVLGEPAIGPIFQQLFQLSTDRTAAAAAAAAAVQHPDGGGGAAAAPVVSAAAAAAAAGPLLYAPQFERLPGWPAAAGLPLLVYLPGIDGTGLAAYRQFPGLAASFDLRAVFLPPEDRTPFAGLVESLAQQIEDEASGLDPSRPVYLLGESFGGLLALALGQKLRFVDRLVLVNPATSFDRSPWPALGPLLPALPPDLYRLLPVLLSPLLANPLSMASRAVTPTDPLPQQAMDLAYGLLDIVPELSSLRVVLPPQTLAWRLQLLKQGAEAVNPTLSKVRQRTLVLVGESDRVIPSAAEAERLTRALPRCHSRTVAGGSHALLQEAAVDLVALMKDEDFYVATRRLTRSNTPAASSPSPSSSFPKPAPGGAAFGTPGPLELPTPGELRRARDAGGLSTLTRLVSPVFLSTDAASGRVQLGLSGLPTPGSGPVLYVGNHQLFAPDMPLMVDRFLEERGQLLRGLAHPMALGTAPGGRADSPPGLEGNGRFGRFLETFGAVPVSGRNLYSLLAAGESALLYPGGVREALKLRGERYSLIWPSRPEFVRMAARLGATLVPFAAVGAEDCATILLDRRDLMGAPLLGDWLRQQQQRTVTARRGVSATSEVEESFISPLVAPRPPARFYFLFGAPIPTDPAAAADRAAMDELYGAVRGGVEAGLGYLLRKREQDPYRELGPRLLYEASWGGRRQAPTFVP